MKKTILIIFTILTFLINSNKSYAQETSLGITSSTTKRIALVISKKTTINNYQDIVELKKEKNNNSHKLKMENICIETNTNYKIRESNTNKANFNLKVRNLKNNCKLGKSIEISGFINEKAKSTFDNKLNIIIEAI